jgi:sulfoxide reductase heme-binding subunit YedZ
MIISPIGYVIGKNRIKHLEFARRAIGVSAFYFALLHGVISLWGQLGGPEQLQYLPDLFIWSLIGGALAFVILLLLAITSFDKVVSYMTYKRWKWLHRLIYAGGVLVILHIWTIGTHLAYSSVQLTAFVALVLLAGLEMVRLTKILNAKYLHLDKAESATLFLAMWVVLSTLIFCIPFLVDNYHGRHEVHQDENYSENEAHL